MNMKSWFEDLLAANKKKPMPILSFPSASLLGVTVGELITDSGLQAKGLKLIADRCETLASVSLMDLSVEAEAFGAAIKIDGNEVPTVYGTLIASVEDADKLAIPTVGAGRTGIYIESAEKAKKLIGDRPVFAGIIGPFSLAGRLIDMTEIMVNCYEEPEMVHTILEKVTEFLIRYSLAYKEAGVDGILIAEPAAGLLSPALFEEFTLRYAQKIINRVQTDEFTFIYHNCGNTIPLIELIKQIGAFGYHFGNFIDIEKMLSIAPNEMIIFGNVDPVSQFRNGTPESVYAATTETLVKCGSRPNFIISSGCDIPPVSPWANIEAFFKAAEDYYSTK